MVLHGSPTTTNIDGSQLRIGIVHARWNDAIIQALLQGAVDQLKKLGVQDQNIIVQSVPGSFELPFACSKYVSQVPIPSNQDLTQLYRLISASQIQSNTVSAVGDLLSTGSPNLLDDATMSKQQSSSSSAFDAIIAIGVLIKGSTMHFEYISDAVSHGLMKLQLDSGVPVIFGVLTALTDEQALMRAGMGTGEDKGHNHGVDWGSAAVEMGANSKKWNSGKFV